jgi:putative ABC transport system permease protein
LPVVQNGRKKALLIVGVGLSPEHVMALPPGGMAYDPKQFVVVWMRRDVLAASFDLEGAFNDLVVSLEHPSDRPEVIRRLDELLAPYGGVGAVYRDKQPSHQLLSGEMSQLENMATVVPVFFLFVAAFLLHMVLSRLILLQRSQLATLKAVGYTDREIGQHYVELALIIAGMGAVAGLGIGAWLGSEFTDMYTKQYFRFPEADYRVELSVVFSSVFVSFGSALIGGLSAVRQTLRLPPAEALHPPAPTRYRATVFDWLGITKLLSVSARMVLREGMRYPIRLLLSATGIALAAGIVVVGGYWFDATQHLLDVQFHGSMREDLTVTFQGPLTEGVVHELGGLEGVRHAEGLRQVPVRFSNGRKIRDGVLVGYPEASELRRVLDRLGSPVSLPVSGLLLSAKLAELLDVKIGSEVGLDVREGDRRHLSAPVSGLIDDAFGLQAHVVDRELSALLGEQASVNQVLLRIDPVEERAIVGELEQMPWVSAVSGPRDFRRQFEEQSAEMIRVFTFILILFASAIAVGVVYNNARVALSARSRDLASLRVLGFARREVASILLGELSLQVLLGLPLGLLFGRAMVFSLVSSVDAETYRLPVLVSERTLALATLVILASAAFSGWVVRRKLDRLDLIGVLKTRE